jgi:hypothetical protein
MAQLRYFSIYALVGPWHQSSCLVICMHRKSIPSIGIIKVQHPFVCAVFLYLDVKRLVGFPS